MVPFQIDVDKRTYGVAGGVNTFYVCVPGIYTLNTLERTIHGLTHMHGAYGTLYKYPRARALHVSCQPQHVAHHNNVIGHITGAV